MVKTKFRCTARRYALAADKSTKLIDYLFPNSVIIAFPPRFRGDCFHNKRIRKYVTMSTLLYVRCLPLHKERLFTFYRLSTHVYKSVYKSVCDYNATTEKCFRKLATGVIKLKQM